MSKPDKKKGYAFVSNEWIFDDRIKNELRLLIYISSLTAKDGYCYASNEHLAKEFNTTTVTISRKIKKLIDLEYVTAEYFKYGSVIQKRYLRLTKMLSDRYQKCYPTINKNDKDNNTSNNNISNNSPNDIGVYKYNTNIEYDGLKYKSDVKIPKKVSDDNIFELIKKPTDDLKENHFIVVLKKEYWFERFWRDYPRREGKKKSKDKFMNMSYSDIESCIKKMGKYVESVKDKDKKYIKQPLTYLNGRHWEDEIEVKTLVLPDDYRKYRLNDEQRKLLSPEKLKSYDKHVSKCEVEGYYFKPCPVIYKEQ